ncbi:MAG: hypothetical protein BWX80_02628 [Candidatus Hydrogenedentes bacterium ADurb.Bin101]|nr:MAG: hypothetical protein BWX80_02628 [Candidatus Hydrogenedentes bacterium ADurb.Bin101]
MHNDLRGAPRFHNHGRRKPQFFRVRTQRNVRPFFHHQFPVRQKNQQGLRLAALRIEFGLNGFIHVNIVVGCPSLRQVVVKLLQLLTFQGKGTVNHFHAKMNNSVF